MENKYFTPDIEDIRVGYECETHVDPYPNWVNAKIEDGDDLNYIKDGSWKLRVPYLTKEQIEAEGWNFGNSYLLIANFAEEGKDEEIRIGRKDTYKLVYNFYTYKLKIAELNSEKSILFSGECKDINTFRYICKLLKIT